MADIDSNLPVRAAAGDVVVNVLGGPTGGVVIDPASEATLAGVLAGVTALPENLSLEATQQSVLAGVTGIEGKVATEATLSSVLAGVTGIEGYVALEATQQAVLAGVTGIAAQLPAQLGATGAVASLPVVVATDGGSIPVYITEGASNTPVVQFQTDASVASAGTSVNTYSPAAAFHLERVFASGSGRIKVEVRAGLIADIDLPASLRWVGFNATANPNVDIPGDNYILPVGWQLKVVVTNVENQAQNLYSTIVGNL